MYFFTLPNGHDIFQGPLHEPLGRDVSLFSTVLCQSIRQLNSHSKFSTAQLRTCPYLAVNTKRVNTNLICEIIQNTNQIHMGHGSTYQFQPKMLSFCLPNSQTLPPSLSPYPRRKSKEGYFDHFLDNKYE